MHLAVVDPGVGGARRAVALRVGAGDRILVGPDNGLLAVAAESFGGVVEAVDIGDSPECLRPISATFHGRDVFAPVAAALADGAELAALGRADRPARPLELLELPRARRHGDALIAHVLTIDVYGNVALDAHARARCRRAGLAEGGRSSSRRPRAGAGAALGRTFGDVAAGELLAYSDARGRWRSRSTAARRPALLAVRPRRRAARMRAGDERRRAPSERRRGSGRRACTAA